MPNTAELPIFKLGKGFDLVIIWPAREICFTGGNSVWHRANWQRHYRVQGFGKYRDMENNSGLGYWVNTSAQLLSAVRRQMAFCDSEATRALMRGIFAKR